MIGVRGIKNKLKRSAKEKTGSVTTEAAVSLSVFLFAVFSLAYVIKVFFIYNTVQASLNDVSVNLANLCYFYNVSDIKAFSDQISDSAREAGLELEEQRNAFVNAFSSFKNLFASGGSSVPSTQELSLDDLADAVNNGYDLAVLFNDIISNPREELRLFMRILAGKLNYEVTNKLVCFIAQNSLKAELGERLKISGEDPALKLGIREGIRGIDFDQSSIFGDLETIELVAKYQTKPFLFLPGLKLINRVKIVAWTGGRGNPGKAVPDADSDRPEEKSLWEEYDNTKLYFDRGLLIEEEYLETIRPDRRETLQGTIFSSNTGVPAVDAYICRKSGRNSYEVELYDVFSLNPFLKTYSTRPGSIENQIRKHGKRLYDSEIPKELKDKDISKIRRIVVLIVPENSGNGVDQAVINAKENLERYGVEIILHRGFGEYVSEEESQAA